MRRYLLALALAGLAGPTPVRADGLLVPTDRTLPPLALTYEHVTVDIDGQVATTSVEQAYHNNTGRDLEAEYLFPLPPGASVRDFSMWVGGRRYRGEAVEADRARQTYEDIVRRLKDPGLLEYVGRDLWRMRIYPVPRFGEQKVEIRFTSVLPREGDLVCYSYPLRTGQAPRRTSKDFTVSVRLKSPDPLGPVYSPSHEVVVRRAGRREAVVSYERTGCLLDRDFRLYFAPRSGAVGVSLLAQSDPSGDRGYVLLLLSPRSEPREPAVPRDLVFVVDTSASMQGEKLTQAKGAVNQALGSLGPEDRFGLVQFATVATPFRTDLLTATQEQLAGARTWVDRLEARGATDIAGAMRAALTLQPDRADGRTFQVVLVTDGLPTSGLTEPKEILDEVRRRAGEATRIFTLGVGDDVDAPLLDQLAATTRGSSTYVRTSDSLEDRAARLLAKLRRPVRTGLELKVAGTPRLVEMYPPALPDLFDGEQLQVVGRYEGHGPATLTLSGHAGDRVVTESYDVRFPATATDHDFIAPLWARRKVGYLLDQVRQNGETSEVKEELVRLARDYAIATPYTSLLVVPEESPSGAAASRRPVRRRHSSSPPLSAWIGPGWRMGGGTPPRSGMGMGGMGMGGMSGMGGMGGMGGGMGGMGGGAGFAGGGGGSGGSRRTRSDGTSGEFEKTSPAVGVPSPFSVAPVTAVPSHGKAAVDLAQRVAELKTGERGEASDAVKVVAGVRLQKVGGAWVDDRHRPSDRTLKLRCLGSAYFRLLARHPELKAVLALGDRVTWVSPSGTALVIDRQGPDDVADADLDRLFPAPK